MKTRKDRDQLLLAIYPTTRGFGFVVFEGRNRTIDWGTKEARGDKNRVALQKAGELMALYRPELLILENTEAAGSRRADRIRNLHRRLIDLATTHKIVVRQFARSEIKAAFAKRGASTRYEIGQAISREFTDLEPWLPRPKKIWESEDRKLSIFDAAALALTFYDTRKNREASKANAVS
jgi:hypothetical protein